MSDVNTAAGATLPQAAVVIERTYRASVEDLWALWTTKAGFESWWGPEGFRVEVHAMDPRPGGAFEYDMIADAPEMVEAMRSMGRPASHMTRGSFAEFRPLERLTLVHIIDFVPDSPVYESKLDVSFRAAGDQATMIVTVHPHLDPFMTRMTIEGFTSQLGKLDRRFG
jgi:uncharacterized protein YndB with AHSA1/START domain